MIRKNASVENSRKEEKIKSVKKAVKQLVYIIASILGIFALLLFIVPAFFRVAAGDSLAQQEKEIAKLEKYYQNGKYEKMCEYYSDIDKSGGAYEKYGRICGLYEVMIQGIEELEKIEEYEEIEAEYLQECIQICMSQLSELNEMESLGFPYGEDEGAMYIKQQYMDALKKYMLLTDDEIATAAGSYVDEKTDYMELAEIAAQRIEEERQ